MKDKEWSNGLMEWVAKASGAGISPEAIYAALHFTAHLLIHDVIKNHDNQQA